METIEECVRRLLKTDNDGEGLALALTSKSGSAMGNERLEFLGNAVLNMRLAEAIYGMEPQFAPGKMSLMCNYLRSNPVLVLVGREGGLAISLARHHREEGGKVTDKMVSTAFEAIVGTLYENAGYEAASEFISHFLLTEELITSSEKGKGAITDLKELKDRKPSEVVIHHSFSESSADGELVFCHTTTINGKTVTGEGRTKKMAETKAAAKALEAAMAMGLL